ncbi:hypothetical protein E8E12_007260 [Didymella heteroderae]|uniref:Heterokaryon incompatibility domain-containing protein n=1 Tax=Didymella heteroderae TaxID=1769908 RepID=A0A9P5C1F8_9PLEO|nr:hypothetical protein E8E12_007260 [Didymella heteroderae]
MRLLDVRTYKLHTFYNDAIPPYAILSHTWLPEHDEVTFARLHFRQKKEWLHLPGARKLEFTCREADSHGYSWAWIDTCCIDKTNSSELSEAINSMFQWYQKAAVCYVYLSDIDAQRKEKFLNSRWWTRAWTLQELLAPGLVQFFDKKWQYLGTKSEHAQQITSRLNIDAETLRDPEMIHKKSVAQRMSWAAYREATRAEDIAYALLGIFQINMTMQYGEGDEAFIRLQKEILRNTDDMSLFAWNITPLTFKEIFKSASNNGIAPADSGHKSRSRHGMYAPGPINFEFSGEVDFLRDHVGEARAEDHHGTLTLYAPMVSHKDVKISKSLTARVPMSEPYWIALLPCGLRGWPHLLLGLILTSHNNKSRRWKQGGLLPFVEPRTTRQMFWTQRTIATFLVGSDIIAKAQNMNIKVDSTDYISQIKAMSKDTWTIMQEEPHAILRKEGLPQGEVTNSMILRCATSEPGQYLYICLQLKLNANETDRIALQYSQTGVQEFKQTWSAAEWRDNHSFLLGEGKWRSLSASITTKVVYNQAASTLIIRERETSAAEDSDGSIESFDSAQAYAQGRAYGHLRSKST